MDFTSMAVSDTLGIYSDLGVDLLEEDIDDVIFQTNTFLTNNTFVHQGGPFFWILQMSMALAALFAIIVGAQMTWKMMTKGEGIDVMKLFRPLAIAIVLCWWYPPAETGIAGGRSGSSILSLLAYIPNCIGSYTHDLYEAEATQINDRFREVQGLLHQREAMIAKMKGQSDAAAEAMGSSETQEAMSSVAGAEDSSKLHQSSKEAQFVTTAAGVQVLIDKIIMLIALVVFRIGWWATIYCQQILLGMLTIFGPIQWAFSCLPKWESAWSKWIIRYLTVHFYGAMLYFVGFYVLLLFDIVLSIQIDNLNSILGSDADMASYLRNAFFSAGYMMAASVVALKCLNLVPDLAAWMIPEGDTAFSTRNFGEGVASQIKQSVAR